MSFINRHSKEIFCKVIYAGPSKSGKTSNIQWIYKKSKPPYKDTEPLCFSLDSSSSSFFDFLPLSVGKIQGFSTRFHLYTMPGGDVFPSTKKMILKGLDGLVFVADSNPLKRNSNIEYLNNLKTALCEEGFELKKTPLVIQYNKRDMDNTEPLSRMKNLLNHYNCPDIEASAQTGQGVFETLQMISKIIINGLRGGSL